MQKAWNTGPGPAGDFQPMQFSTFWCLSSGPTWCPAPCNLQGLRVLPELTLFPLYPHLSTFLALATMCHS